MSDFEVPKIASHGRTSPDRTLPSRIGHAALLIAAGVVAFLLISWIASHCLFWIVRQFFISEGSRELPSVNPHFIRAGASALVLVVGAILLSGRGGPGRWLASLLPRRWILVMALISIVWNTTLGMVKQDHLFDHEGNPASHWASRPDGSLYITSGPGSDPVTGVTLKEITPEAAQAIWHWKQGPPRKLPGEPEDFIHPVSGEPMVWVGGEKLGSYTFYDGPGFDMGTGEMLVAADREWLVHFEAAKREAMAAAEERRRLDEAEDARRLAREEKAAEEARKAVEKEAQRALLQVGTLVADSTSPQVTLTMRSGDQVASRDDHENELIAILRERLPGVRFSRGFFKPDFFQSEWGKKLLAEGWGDSPTVAGLGIANAHLITDLKMESGRLSTNQNLIQIRANLAYEIRDQAGQLVASGTIAGTGAAFSEREAIQAAIERGIEADGVGLIEWLKGNLP